MAWTAGVDRAAGNIITHTDWNNYLGATGSLQYLYAIAGAGASVPTQGASSGRMTIVTPASAGTKGNYTQAFASTAFASLYILFTMESGPSIGQYLAFDISVGADTFEVVKVPDIVIASTVASQLVPFGFPFAIASASRIAVRAANVLDATALTTYVSMTILG